MFIHETMKKERKRADARRIEDRKITMSIRAAIERFFEEKPNPIQFMNMPKDLENTPIYDLMIGRHAGHGVAVEIPEHGDLIDRDAFKKHIENTYCQKCKRDKILCHKNCDYGDLMEELDYAPVILEANR